LADIVLPHTITPNTLADADEVQENFDALADDALNKTGDTMTGTLNVQAIIPVATNTYDIGTTALRVKDIYIAGSIVGLSAGNTFTTIAVSGQSNVVADSSSDTLTFAAGTGITLTTTAASDTVTITATGAAQAGSSAINFAPGGTIYQSVTTTGTSGAGLDTLYSKAIAANVLANDGERITFRASGTLANNSNEKRIKVSYGATTVLDLDGTSPINAQWVLEGTITRLTGTTQWTEAVLTIGSFSTGVTTLAYTSAAAAGETLSNAITLLIEAEGTDTNDIVMKTVNVSYWGKTSN
jgi:hypothetical protein